MMSLEEFKSMPNLDAACGLTRCRLQKVPLGAPRFLVKPSASAEIVLAIALLQDTFIGLCTAEYTYKTLRLREQ